MSVSTQTKPAHPKLKNMPVFADKSPPPVTTKLEVGTRFTKILETEPNSPCFTQNHPKTQKSMDFNQNYLEPVKLPISGDVSMTEPPAAILESPTGAAIILALENPSKTAEISQKQPESPISSGQTTQIHSLHHL